MPEFCYSCKKIILRLLTELNESSYCQKKDGAGELSISPPQRLAHRRPIARPRGAAGLRGSDKAPAKGRPVPLTAPSALCSTELPGRVVPGAGCHWPTRPAGL